MLNSAWTLLPLMLVIRYQYGPATALPALGGLLVDATRPEAIFLVAIASGVGAFVLARRLPGAAVLEARSGTGAA